MLDDMNPIKKKMLALIVVAILLISGVMAYTLMHSEERTAADTEDRLVIYSYDSFVSWGLSNSTIHRFEQMYNVTVEVRTYGDAGSVLNRVITEKSNPQADVIVGVDNSLLQKALDADVLDVYKPENISKVSQDLIFDSTYHVVPYDYGYIALVYNKSVVTEPPQTFEDLLSPQWKDRIILENPQTSSTGLAFLDWTIAANNNELNTTYWQALSKNAKITESWDSAFDMFEKGEGDIMVSYATDPAYYVEYYGDTNYSASFLKINDAGKTTGYLQVEGLGVIKGCQHPDLARKFVEFALTEDFQKEIPLTNWMFPANPAAPLPASFDYAMHPQTDLSIDPQVLGENQNTWLDEWARAVQA